MAKVFLDANVFIDAIHRKPESQILNQLLHHTAIISTLSFHIYCYVFKIKLPNNKVKAQRDTFQLVDMTSQIVNKALAGPTQDFEDNIQLHSSIQANCDYFLTSDTKLLKLAYFGKTEIIDTITK